MASFMTADTIRTMVKVIGAILLVTIVNGVFLTIMPESPAPEVAALSLAFVLLAIFAGRAAVIAGLAVGTLELALVLPGDAFAVSRGDDALALIVTLVTGAVLAWHAGRQHRYVAQLVHNLSTRSRTGGDASAFFQELSHRISNDFSTLVALAAIRSREAAQEETREALGEISGRMIVLGRVYRRLRMSETEHRQTQAGTFLRELCEDLQVSTLGLRPLSLELDAEEISLPVGHAVLLGLIANELLTNAVKHAFPDDRKGVVSVKLRPHPFRRDTLEFTVSDDGVGFVQTNADGTHLGRRLLSSLAAQLNGDITYARIDGRTVASLLFPAPGTALVRGTSDHSNEQEGHSDAA